VYMLMQDEFRDRFFDYVRSYRDIDNYRAAHAVEKTEPETLLEGQLKMNLNTLEGQWDSFITQL
jgi:hypothetical protein